MKKIFTVSEYSIPAIRLAVEYARKYPSFKVNGLYAAEFEKLSREDSELYESAAQLVKNSRWNPCVGMYFRSHEKLSEEALCRSILYSSRYFCGDYRVFYGETYYNDSLAKTVYAGRFDVMINSGADESHWLECSDGSRILVLPAAELTDVTQADENEIKNAECITFEEYAKGILSMPLEIPVVRSGVCDVIYTGREKAALDYEKASAIKKQDVRDEVRKFWLDELSGKNPELPKYEEAVTDLKIDSTEIEAVAFKLSEDTASDTVIRVRETVGREKSVRLLCDSIEAGFRFEILPYETITFRIDSEGFVTETFIQE